MTAPITVDLILNTIQEWVENKQPIDATTWLDAALKMNILVADNQERYWDLHQKVSQRKVVLIENGAKIGTATAKIEASDDYRLMKLEEAKIERVAEFVRLSKIQARMSNDERIGAR